MRNYFQAVRGCVLLAWRAGLFLALATLVCASARAGGGPENVLLVVNSSSAGSQTIANYYQQIRPVPASNVVYIDWRGPTDRTDINTFREKILLPVFTAIETRQLSAQIDCIAYSSDFPWAIDFAADVPPARAKQQNFQFPSGSLSGLTYLYVPVLTKQPLAYADFQSNRYMRLREQLNGVTHEMDVGYNGVIPNDEVIKDGYKKLRDKIDDSSVGSHAFRGWYGWGPKGEVNEVGGMRYMLSTVLGVTFGRGNTVGEVVEYLQRGATADGKFPPGTIYFMDSGSGPAAVRSWTRKPGFPMAVEQLKKLRVAAQIEKGDIPLRKNDVQGLLAGIADFNWKASGSTIRPGAICENLTSYGAIFDRTASQTPATEFLRNGAAGTSGTVVEPFSIQNKFPHAMIQVHYARGSSLAEAFYQAVYAPYQLLVLGDPLCQPWANIPQVSVQGAAAGDVLKGKVTLRPSARMLRGGTADRFELFVDGVRLKKCGAGETLELDTTQFSDGFHDVRVVGIEKSVIQAQGTLTLLVTFDNYGKTISFETEPKKTVGGGRPIKLVAKSPGAVGVAFYRNREIVAKFAGEAGETTVDSKIFGEGPVTLQAIGWGSTNVGDVSKNAASAPVVLTIESGAAGR
jgi:hypothetical protein